MDDTAAMSALLPDVRSLVTSLVNGISDNLLEPNSSNPLANASVAAKNLLLTLHVLFPTELLPALDLLDRKLVTRLALHEHQESTLVDAAQNAGQGTESSNLFDTAITNSRQATVTATATDTLRSSSAPPIYIVRSAQQSSASHSRFRDNTAAQYYEVRTRAWNCSCPAFAFQAYPATAPGRVEDHDTAADTWTQLSTESSAKDDADNADTAAWTFGGISLGSDLPLCKHLLACVLAERVQALAHCVVEQRVSDEEMAGWLAA